MLTPALLAYLAFVVYGSLVPLDYRPVPIGTAWDAFGRIPYLHLDVGSRADWIANGVLYFPLGALLVLRLRQAAWPAWLAVAAALPLCGALAVGVEFAQQFFPPRTVSLNDLIAEGIGLTLGALVGLWIHRRGLRFEVPMAAGRAWLMAHGLALYAVTYVAYSLFPYDLLISAAELQQKIDSDLWGWWLAGAAGPRLLVVVVSLLVEAGLAVPLGLWWAKRQGHRRVPLGQAIAVGVSLGILMELAQLLIASGISQGASVLARAFGIVGGAVIWQYRAGLSLGGVRNVLARHAWWLAVAYVVLLLAVNGWFDRRWHGWRDAAAVWAQVRLLPFYYHYYTSEARALVSLSSVALMYTPLAVLAWSLRATPVGAACWAAGVATAIEASKLFLDGLRPDPTNVLIAGAAAALLVHAAAWARREAPAPTVSAGPRSELPTASGKRPRASAALLLLPTGLLVWHLWSSPAFAVVSAAFVLLCAGLTWWRPALALLIAAAAMPALDLAPWTGRLYWDEYDLLLATLLAVGFVRTTAATRRLREGPWMLVSSLLAVSLLASTVQALLPLTWPDANSFASYHSPYNALRIVKGAAWAALFIGFARRLDASGLDAWRPFAHGLGLGLAWVVMVVLWERLAFVGLFDFADEYRVTGTFSAMHKGGAYIECYLALAMPFVATLLLDTRRAIVRGVLVLLLLGTGYALFVTYSRNGYAALVVGLVMWAVLAWRAQGGAGHQRLWLVLAPLALLAAGLPVLLGSQAQERLAHWQRDLAVRQAHWADALAMRDDDVATALFGQGVGTFPLTHLWRSAERVHAATFQLARDVDRSYLRLGGGALTYLDQFVALPATSPLLLTLELRSGSSAPLQVSVCEKWMLTSRRCASAQVAPGAPNQWTHAEVSIDIGVLQQTAGPMPRPLKFALYSPSEGMSVDVTGIRLTTGDGEALLENGDFDRHLDRWLFSTDVDPPWHIHSLPVAVLFDQGWFGVVAWALLLAAALGRGLARAWQGSAQAAVVVAALAALLASGLLNTLIDEPRFLWLLLVLSWYAMAELRQPVTDSASRRSRLLVAQPVRPNAAVQTRAGLPHLQHHA